MRLEHELQTAMMRQRRARPRFRSFAHGMARHPVSSLALLARASREVPAVLLFKGIGVAYVLGAMFAGGMPFRDMASIKHTAPERFEKLRPPRSRHLSRGASSGGLKAQRLAGCTNATQPEPFTVSTLFLRPLAVN